MEFKRSIKGRELLNYENETFYEHRRGKRSPVITWRCGFNNQGCRARIKTLHGKIVGQASPVHFHPNRVSTTPSTQTEDKRDYIIQRLMEILQQKSQPAVKLSEMSSNSEDEESVISSETKSKSTQATNLWNKRHSSATNMHKPLRKATLPIKWEKY